MAFLFDGEGASGFFGTLMAVARGRPSAKPRDVERVGAGQD